MDKVCTTETGSHIPSCVNVNGDKKTLTSGQKETIGNNFRGFIVRHNGQDITRYGAEVSGGSQGDQDFISAVSQFVGTLTGGWAGVDIDLGSSRHMSLDFSESGSSWNREFSSSDAAYSSVMGGEKLTGVNTEHRETFAKAGNAARTLMHERVHWLWGGDKQAVNVNGSAHQALDAEARARMKAGGLSSGGCDPEGGIIFGLFGYPGCQ
jgi:hypothetical protein